MKPTQRKAESWLEGRQRREEKGKRDGTPGVLHKPQNQLCLKPNLTPSLPVDMKEVN
jgi:hypothetical protein